MSDKAPEDVSKDELWNRLRRLEKEVFPNRRAVLKGAATAAGAGALGFTAGNASAQASTEDGDGNVGDPDDRVDLFADGADANYLNTADLANATSGTIPTAQGDGTLSMESGSSEMWQLAGVEAPTSDESGTVQFTGLSENTEYRLFFSTFLSGQARGIALRLNGDGDSTGNYTYWDETGAKQSGEDEFIVPSTSDACGVAGSIRITETEFDDEYRTGINANLMPGNPDRVETWTREGVHDDNTGISSIELNSIYSGSGTQAVFRGGETLIELWERDYSGN